MGHHKKQEGKRARDDIPTGKGKCPLCHKHVQTLKDHIHDQHKGEKLPK